MKAAHLAGSGDAEALDRMAMKYPTCALAVLSFEIARWDDIHEGSGVLKQFIIPRELSD